MIGRGQLRHDWQGLAGAPGLCMANSTFSSIAMWREQACGNAPYASRSTACASPAAAHASSAPSRA